MSPTIIPEGRFTTRAGSPRGDVAILMQDEQYFHVGSFSPFYSCSFTRLPDGT